MRRTIQMLIAATILAAPAAAQTDNAAASDDVAVMADPESNIATNATDEATMNGIAADPALTMPVAPPVIADPEATDAVVTPDTGEDGGFPWGLLGILGLLGLIGRFRS